MPVVNAISFYKMLFMTHSFSKKETNFMPVGFYFYKMPSGILYKMIATVYFIKYLPDFFCFY